MPLTKAQQRKTDKLRLAGDGDRTIANKLGVTYGAVRWDRKHRAEYLEPPREGVRILLYDIETMAALNYTWGAYQQNIIATDVDWYMLSFAYKWLGSDDIGYVGLNHDPKFKARYDNDKLMAKKLWDLFDQADIIVAHNGDNFDERKANQRFEFHGLGPPSGYKTVDTKKVAARYFNHYRNTLDDLGRLYTREKKLKHHGFDLWIGCRDGNPDDWAIMEKYNRQDVVVLEALYLRLRKWDTKHPNVALIERNREGCPVCGASDFMRRGFAYTNVSVFQRWQCKTCGHYSRSRLSESTRHNRPLKVNIAQR